MARRKRQSSTFNLSFLDIMSCGFGAVVLVFLIIDHSLEVEIRTVNAEMLSEVALLEEDIREGEAGLVRLRNAIEETDQEILDVKGTARTVTKQIQEYEEINVQQVKARGATLTSISEKEKAIANLEALTKQMKLDIEIAEGQSPLSFVGDGNRQYLSGLKLLGKRTLIMLDKSTSMLSDQIVKIKLLQFEQDPAKKRSARKWTQARETTRWLISNLSENSDFQIMVFSSEPTFLAGEGDADWLGSGEVEGIEKLDQLLSVMVPDGGTNLFKAFEAINTISPPPDNVILITDGLPTLGKEPPKKELVNERERLALFEEAVAALPYKIPINILLFPLRGDRAAPASYWELAYSTSGSMLSVANDWP